MSPQVFYRKWRPQTLSEVAGQEHVTQTLLQSLATGHVSHAYLFSGPRGTGKTSTGRILAKAVNCLNNGHGEPCNQCAVCQAITQGNSMDVVELDAASNRGIDEIRSLREKVAFVPGASHYKVYIIDEVHMLTEQAANALLKTLEEPPPHVIFILATTDPHKMPATILSRCQHFQFHRLTQTAVAGRLAFICEKEGVTAPPEALRLIARSSTGSLRDAENILEQMVAYYGPQLELAQVKELLGLSGDLRAREMARHILGKNLSAGLAAINQANSDGLDLRQFLRTLVDYLRELLLLKAGASDAIEVTPDELIEMKSLAEANTMESILQVVKLFSQIDMRMDNYSTLPLELALVECIVPREETSSRTEPREAIKPQPVSVPRPVGAISRPSQSVAKTNPPPVPLPNVESRPVGALAVSQSATPEVSQGGTAPAPSTPITPPPAGAPPLDYLRLHWREFINSLRGEGSTGTLDALLRHACEPIAIEGEQLVLGFYSSFHKEKIEDPKYCFLIERKLNQFTGGVYKLRCVLTEKKQRPSTSSSRLRSESPVSGQAGTSTGSSASREQATDKSGQAGLVRDSSGGKKSPGYLVEAALKEGGRIINVEEK